jgi:NADH-quinone oxidoreductase subunit C
VTPAHATAAVPPGERVTSWRTDVEGLVRVGYDQLDFLTAVDFPQDSSIEGGAMEIVIHLVRLADQSDVFAHIRIPRAAPRLESLTPVLPAAAWHEREMHEMFGIEIIDHPDLRPLLLMSSEGPPPLRKDTPLAARVETPWPGAVEESGGRRSRRTTTPPGVPPEWMDGRT